jgi:hypothetical protein
MKSLSMRRGSDLPTAATTTWYFFLFPNVEAKGTWAACKPRVACDPHVAHTSFISFYKKKIGLILIGVVNIIW